MMVLSGIHGVASESQDLRLSSQANETYTESDRKAVLDSLPEISVGNRLSRRRESSEQDMAIMRGSQAKLPLGC